MHALLRVAISAILAAFAGWTACQLAWFLDPSLLFSQVRLCGTSAFFFTIVACMFVMRAQANAAEH